MQFDDYLDMHISNVEYECLISRIVSSVCWTEYLDCIAVSLSVAESNSHRDTEGMSRMLKITAQCALFSLDIETLSCNGNRCQRLSAGILSLIQNMKLSKIAYLLSRNRLANRFRMRNTFLYLSNHGDHRWPIDDAGQIFRNISYLSFPPTSSPRGKIGRRMCTDVPLTFLALAEYDDICENTERNYTRQV